MTLSFEEKLIKIYGIIEKSCNSSVRIFDRKKGHSNRLVGTAAYEERQKLLREITTEFPEVIEFLCRKGSHNYFKFEGTTIKIISSIRESLGKNVFAKNIFEKGDEFESFDPLRRIIYKADYDLEANEVVILECHYLEIDRNDHRVIKEINILNLVNEKGGFVTEVVDDAPAATDLPEAGLLQKLEKIVEDDSDK